MRHRGPLKLEPGVVWRDDDGWRFACPHGCPTTGDAFRTPTDAAHAFFAHWERERANELAQLARAQNAAEKSA